MITIVLAEDHNIMRQALRILLETEGNFKVIGESADGLETVKLVEQLQPDILISDMMMNGINGTEITRQVRKSAPKTQVIILSMYNKPAYVVEAFTAGAKAYVLKEATADELVNAVNSAAVGRRYLSSTLSEIAIEALMEISKERAVQPHDMLTDREREVLHLAANGDTNAKIAEKLYISRRTVEAHRASMMRKLNLKTKVDLLKYAMDHGILSEGN